MSLDPLSHGLPPQLAAYVAGELSSLAHDARALQARLSTGDVVSAIVLPSNGLTDVIKIDGLRVAAELPPTVLPGESIVVEVTGFSDDRILLHIVAQAAARESGVPQNRAADGDPASLQTRSGPPSTAIPAGRPSEPAPPAAGSRNVARPDVPAMRQVLATRPVPAPVAMVEARLAAAHATTSLGPAQSTRPSSPVQASLPVARERGTALITAALTRPVISQRVSAVPVESRTAPAPPVAAPASRPVYTEPATLLRALQLPLNTENLKTARQALDSPAHLAPALTALDRALSATTDARVVTARALLAFVARIEPRSPVLAAQLAAFVDHVVDGREGKLAQLLTAHAQAASAPAADRGMPVTSAHSAPAAPVSPSRAPGAADSLALERVALRQAGIDTDLKSQLLAIAHATSGTRETDTVAKSISTALGGALGAITALQLNAATALAANPDGVAFWLPVALPEGFARAQIQIDRKTPQAQNGALDGDNFHIGFVLETQHLGTIAIDLLTVGRVLSVGVKTESERARNVFATALEQLQQRLEALRYRVVKADAGVAARGVAVAEMSTPPDAAKPAQATRLVDLDA